jgi:hypothetical protein
LDAQAVRVRLQLSRTFGKLLLFPMQLSWLSCVSFLLLLAVYLTQYDSVMQAAIPWWNWLAVVVVMIISVIVVLLVGGLAWFHTTLIWSDVTTKEELKDIKKITCNLELGDGCNNCCVFFCLPLPASELSLRDWMVAPHCDIQVV